MIRLALVGGGQMAQRVYLPALAKRRDVAPVVLVEPRDDVRGALARAYRFARAVASVEDLEAGEADCALLLTRPADRRGPLERLLDLGLDVLSEKPMASDLAEAEAFAGLAERAGRILMIGFNRRFMPAYVHARQFVGDRAIHTARVWKHGANVWGHSIHVLDVLRWFCGEPACVRAEGRVDAGGRETAVAAVIRFAAGTIGVFETSAHYGMRKDELEAHGPGWSLRVYAPDKAITYERGREETYRHGKDAWYTDAEQHWGFAQEIDHFLQAVRTRSTPTCSAEDALETHRLAAEIVRAVGASRGAHGKGTE